MTSVHRLVPAVRFGIAFFAIDSLSALSSALSFTKSLVSRGHTGGLNDLIPGILFIAPGCSLVVLLVCWRSSKLYLNAAIDILAIGAILTLTIMTAGGTFAGFTPEGTCEENTFGEIDDCKWRPHYNTMLRIGESAPPSGRALLPNELPGTVMLFPLA